MGDSPILSHCLACCLKLPRADPGENMAKERETEKTVIPGPKKECTVYQTLAHLYVKSLVHLLKEDRTGTQSRQNLFFLIVYFPHTIIAL